MDREKMAQDLALAFSVSQQQIDKDQPQNQLQKLLEDYCAAYGYFRAKSDDVIKELIHRGE